MGGSLLDGSATGCRDGRRKRAGRAVAAIWSSWRRGLAGGGGSPSAPQDNEEACRGGQRKHVGLRDLGDGEVIDREGVVV